MLQLEVRKSIPENNQSFTVTNERLIGLDILKMSNFHFLKISNSVKNAARMDFYWEGGGREKEFKAFATVRTE